MTDPLHTGHVMQLTLEDTIREMMAHDEISAEQADRVLCTYYDALKSHMRSTSRHAHFETGIVCNHRQIDNTHEFVLEDVNIEFAAPKKLRVSRMLVKGEEF